MAVGAAKGAGVGTNPAASCGAALALVAHAATRDFVVGGVAAHCDCAALDIVVAYDEVAHDAVAHGAVAGAWETTAVSPSVGRMFAGVVAAVAAAVPVGVTCAAASWEGHR